MMHGWYILRNDLTALCIHVDEDGEEYYCYLSTKVRAQATRFEDGAAANRAIDRVHEKLPFDVITVVYFPTSQHLTKDGEEDEKPSKPIADGFEWKFRNQ